MKKRTVEPAPDISPLSHGSRSGTAGDNTLGSFALSKRPVVTMVQKDSDIRPIKGMDAKTLPEPDKDDIQEISIALLVH